MVRIKNDVFVYAEGGGSGANSASLQAEYRQAFAAFFSRTILSTARRPRVVTCGGRDQALEMFKTAVLQGKNALLLVDSEAAVSPSHAPHPTQNGLPWAHLRAHDGWNMPAGSSDSDCHLMTQCMESWFLADWQTVQNYFGRGFITSTLPKGPIEAIAKLDLYAALQRATNSCETKSRYSKGEHSFKILSLIDPSKVIAASPWAKRLIDELAKRKP